MYKRYTKTKIVDANDFNRLAVGIGHALCSGMKGNNMIGEIIQVTIKSVYGENKVYPLCDKSRAFADMLNQKTLTMRNIEHIKRIGFTVVVVQETTTL